MNIFSIFGFLLAAAVVGFGLRLASEDLTLFWDEASLFIVLGGSLASTAISFQLNRLVVLFKIFIRRMIFGQKYNYQTVITEVIQACDAFKKGTTAKELADKTKDPFFKEALMMLEEGVISTDLIVGLIQKRNENMLFNNMQEANKIKTVGKFPPAFGMIGTTIGMIVLLANLGGEDAMKMIGPAMGVCLITTLYGAVFANALFIPVAENLVEDSKETHLKNKMIVKGIELMLLKTNPIIVAEELNSFLNPKDRLDWKKALGA